MLKIRMVITALCAVLLFACSTSKKSMQQHTANGIVIPPDAPGGAKKKTGYESVQTKYAKYLGVDQEAITNIRLYQFIDRWASTPYKWGGTDEKGIDCSAFIQRLLADVYGIHIPRRSVQQFFKEQIEPLDAETSLSEGDLVFFRTLNNTMISHVGLYLQNRKFVNASTSKGVSIASLDDAYWKKCYVTAGRIKLKNSNEKTFKP